MYNEKAKKRKERYFKKVYDNASLIGCACGCGTIIKSKDRYGRDKRYVSGHNNRIYKDPTQYKREWNHRNRETRYRYKVKYLHNRRAHLIKTLGGKCVVCLIKYNGNNACIFDFHHRDPSEKEFSINMSTLSRKSLKDVLKELNKCSLLCSNCHRLLHFSGY